MMNRNRRSLARKAHRSRWLLGPATEKARTRPARTGNSHYSRLRDLGRDRLPCRTYGSSLSRKTTKCQTERDDRSNRSTMITIEEKIFDTDLLDGQSHLNLAVARLRRWSTKGYLNMDQLKQ